MTQKTRRSSRPTLSLPVGARDHIRGPSTASLTLVEYGDYECPHCGRAYPIVKTVERRLGERLRFVFRNFPLTDSHPHAALAAEAAEIAGAHGAFWPMHDYLFEHQHALDDDHLRRYATAVGLQPAQFDEAFATHAYAARVIEDYRSGEESGVEGTPTFFINGVRYDGSWEERPLVAALQRAGRRA